MLRMSGQKSRSSIRFGMIKRPLASFKPINYFCISKHTSPLFNSLKLRLQVQLYFSK